MEYKEQETLLCNRKRVIRLIAFVSVMKIVLQAQVFIKLLDYTGKAFIKHSIINNFMDGFLVFKDF